MVHIGPTVTSLDFRPKDRALWTVERCLGRFGKLIVSPKQQRAAPHAGIRVLKAEWVTETIKKQSLCRVKDFEIK